MNTHMTAGIIINPAFGGRGDFQKGLWIFTLAHKIWEVRVAQEL